MAQNRADGIGRLQSSLKNADAIRAELAQGLHVIYTIERPF
jgi:hypothetical protein